MKLQQLCDDRQGSTIVEYTLIMPIFILAIFGAVQAGLLIWAQIGLQHGVDMAARCASVSDAAINAGRDPSAAPANSATNCYNLNGNITANAARVKTYAASQSYGLTPAASLFSVSISPCGNLVSVSYPFNVLGGSTAPGYFFDFNMTLTAQACYPIPA